MLSAFKEGKKAPFTWLGHWVCSFCIQYHIFVFPYRMKVMCVLNEQLVDEEVFQPVSMAPFLFCALKGHWSYVLGVKFNLLKMKSTHVKMSATFFLVWKKYEYFKHFLFFKVNFNRQYNGLWDTLGIMFTKDLTK